MLGNLKVVSFLGSLPQDNQLELWVALNHVFNRAVICDGFTS